MQNNYGYANILMGIFIAWWVNRFFKKYGYNYFETFTLLCFVIGMGMLISALLALFEGVSKINLMGFALIFVFVYITWAIGQFYDKTKFTNYLKAFAAYLLGSLSFIFLGTAIGILIDILKR